MGKDRLRSRTCYRQDGQGTRMGWDENSWMPTHLGESQAWMPGQKWHKHSLRQSYSDTWTINGTVWVSKIFYLQTWTINGYSVRTVQGRELS